jgi:hypothetical protein
MPARNEIPPQISERIADLHALSRIRVPPETSVELPIIQKRCVACEVFMSMTTKITTLWDVKPRSRLDIICVLSPED